MATQVFKCDFCYGTFFETKEEAIAHEHICLYNESNKRCNTCKYYEEMGYPIGGSDMRCRNKNSQLFDKTVHYFLDDKNIEEFFPCEFWEKEI